MDPFSCSMELPIGLPHAVFPETSGKPHGRLEACHAVSIIYFTVTPIVPVSGVFAMNFT